MYSKIIKINICGYISLPETNGGLRLLHSTVYKEGLAFSENSKF